MSKEDFEKAMAELDIAAVKNRKYEKMADTIRAHVAELETMVQGHKLAADAAMGLAGDLKAKLAEVEQESIRRGDLIADKAFKLVDVRAERDALRERIEGAEKVWLYWDRQGKPVLVESEPQENPVTLFTIEHYDIQQGQLVHAVPVSEGEERQLPGAIEYIRVEAQSRAAVAKEIAERIREWLQSTPRKPAHLAFTAGPEREIADLVSIELARGRAADREGGE